jgi:uncharacterized protein (DUF2141 family)
MQKVKYIIATTSLLTALISQNLWAAELVVVVDNIKEIKGSLYISAYNQKESFDANENYLSRKKISVDKNTLTINLGELPAGDYAIKCYQDVNDNGKIDMNGMGIPNEPYGSSGKSSYFGPPSFSDAKFALENNKTLQIHLK